jgi:quinol monooxygenase YgiN
MDAYVVIAEVTVPPERLAEFIAFSLEDARDSVVKEPGCQQFDVLSSADGSPTVVFYEVYDDRAAFEAHLQMPHFFRWRDATQGLITASRISYLNRQR